MATVHVFKIHPLVSESDVKQLFQTFGEIQSIELIVPVGNKMTKEAIILYKEQHSAICALQRLNKATTPIGELDVVSFTVGEKEITPLKPFSEQTLILVKNFKDLLDEKKLIDLFEPYGDINSVSIKKEGRKSMGYGFVDFKYHKNAVDAVKYMNGIEVKGRKLEVAFVERRELRNMQNRSSHPTSDTKQKSNNVIYVTNLYKNATEPELMELFKNFGEITSVNVKIPHFGKPTTVGFVSFEKQEDAIKAMANMDGYILNSFPIKVVLKH